MTTIPLIETSDPSLAPVIAKIVAGMRLTLEDGLALEGTGDFHSLCETADFVRNRLHGKLTGYIINAHLNYTNVCISRCSFCAFSKDAGSPDAYVIDPEEAPSRVKGDVDEIHLVGGINPTLPLDYFISLIRNMHHAFPKATIKAFTAVEIHALAEKEKMPVVDLLRILRDEGLSMLPGGGAEIFAEEIRTRICPKKADADAWLDVHRKAHQLWIPSNATMLFGHVEKPEHRIDHLLRIRSLQDETHGFLAFIPLPCLSQESDGENSANYVDGVMALRQIAIARLMLDNVRHIKAYWKALGIRLAQASLRAGADDLDGTIVSEKVMESAGSDAPSSLSADEIERLIIEAGLEPYRRDSFHRRLEVRSCLYH